MWKSVSFACPSGRLPQRPCMTSWWVMKSVMLSTPSDDLKGISKPFVNVLEDARIERMMKQTYPGLKRSFFEGYKELWDDDFFGVRDEEIANLPLIDRINLYFKGNPEVPFAEDEMVWVDRASKTKTFQDVLQLAAELYDYAQEKQEKKETEQQNPETSSSDTTTEEEQVEETEKQQVENESSDDGESEEQDESDWFTDDDPMEREPKMPEEADLGTPSYEYDETESVTDAALRESLESMVDDSAKEWVYLSYPIQIWIKSLFLVLKFRKR